MIAYREKVYLDQQPEIDAIVRDFIDSLQPMFDEGYCPRGTQPLECRRRDGFIPHRHNHGGYEKQYVTSMRYIWGSGCDLVAGLDTEEANKQYEEAKNVFIRFDASDEDNALLATIPEDKRNYHTLHELGHSDLAERMDEYCDEWLNESDVWYGYRAMYEGTDEDGIHTLMLYVCATQDRYHGAFAVGTHGEFEIQFRDAAELKAKLAALKPEIESVL